MLPGMREDRNARSPRVVLVADPTKTSPATSALDVIASGITLIVHLGALSSVEDGAALLQDTDVLVVEVDPDLPTDMAELRRIVTEIGVAIPVIAAGRSLTTASSRRLRALGVVETVSLPIDPLELEEALDAARKVIVARSAHAPAHRGKLLAFCGSIGGAGTTMLATQSGCFMAASASTCLIDLNIQAATSAVFLNMAPRLGLADLVSAGARMDVELVKSVAADHASGLRVIAGPPDMVPLEMVSKEFVQNLVRLALSAFDVVIVELPAAWTDWSLAVLSMADIIALVSALSVPGIRQAKRQFAVLDSNGLTPATRVILNRVPRPLFRTVDLGESEKLLGHKISHSISNDYTTVNAAIDQGRTLSNIKAGSAVEKDVKAMAMKILAELGVHA